MNQFKTAALLISVLFFSMTVNAADIKAGKDKAAQVCAACHGVDGNSSSGDYPKLAGQHEDYLVKAMISYKDGSRKDPIMSGMSGPLSEQDMRDLAAWFASQKSGLTVKE